VDPFVFAAVLCAACMHASWNAVIKVKGDRLSAMLMMTVASSAICLVLMPFFSLPAAASLPWLIASAMVHTVYKLSLTQAYEHGDLSQVYPLARGAAPLIVAVVSVFALKETMTPTKVFAVLAIGGGVCLMALARGTVSRIPPKAFMFAVLAAGSTASYTLLDGIGARLSGSVAGFIILLSILDGISTSGYVLARRGPSAFAGLPPLWRSGLCAAIMSLGSYWIALWAFTKAPIALVAALRETSVLFAIVIGVVLLKEKAGPARILAALLITSGVVLMRL
jgi:drug/metabolite transporter (DMT)-like permease